jgi:hypothetical protein
VEAFGGTGVAAAAAAAVAAVVAAVVAAAEVEAAVVVVTDLTAHLGGTASTAKQLTRSTSPARHPRPVPRPS